MVATSPPTASREDADVRIEDYPADWAAGALTLSRQGQTVANGDALNAPGRHNALNAAAAVATDRRHRRRRYPARAGGLPGHWAPLRFPRRGSAGAGQRQSGQRDAGGRLWPPSDRSGRHAESGARRLAGQASGDDLPAAPLRVLRDLYDDFANVLSQVDVLLMLDVYAAGEAPIPGADKAARVPHHRSRGKLDPILVSMPIPCRKRWRSCCRMKTWCWCRAPATWAKSP